MSNSLNNNTYRSQQVKTIQIDSLLIIAVAIAIMSLLIRQYNEADTWWQVAIGKNILETLTIPRVDHFTAAGWGRPYHDSHWLFQVLVATADRFGGTIAVGLIPVGVWCITFIFSYLSIRKWLSPIAASILLFVLAIACNARFIPRPDIVTCFMIAIFYYKLQAGYYTTYAQLFLLGILQIIWSNSHGLFVIGPFMGCCYLVEAFYKKVKNPHVDLKPTVRLLSVLIFTSLCTPFGIDGWHYALQIAQEAGPNALVIYKDLEELKPIFSINVLSNPDCWAFYLLLASAITVTFPLLVNKKVPGSRIIIVLALLMAAGSGRRNIPLFAIAVAPLIAESASKLFPAIIFNKKYVLTLTIVIACFTMLPLSGRYYQWFNYNPIRFGFGAPTEFQPAGLPNYLQQANFNGQIYNNDLFGGYLMYRGIVPLLDGRWEVYDADELFVILKAPFDPPSWDWVVMHYDIRGVLLRHGEAATKALVTRFLTDGSFTAVYQDDVSAFWTKTSLK